MSEITTYEKLSAYGLLGHLRNLVASKRANQKRPSRDTVWSAFNCDGDLTGLKKLIVQEGERILQEHESKFEKTIGVEA